MRHMTFGIGPGYLETQDYSKDYAFDESRKRRLKRVRDWRADGRLRVLRQGRSWICTDRGDAAPDILVWSGSDQEGP